MRILVRFLLLLSTLSVTAGGFEPIIVNESLPAIEVRTCRNWIRVDTTYARANHTLFQPADTVLIIQMKGAVVDSQNAVASMGVAGRFERNMIARRNGDTLFLRHAMLAAYQADGVVQVVRMHAFPQTNDVPSYDSTLVYVLTALPFDGRTGGVLAVHASDTVHLWCDVSMTGRGFRNDEGICVTGHSPNAGYGTAASSGGGGHGGSGGYGRTTSPTPAPKPGMAVSYTSGVNWIFMGGGPGSIATADSCAGGGIIIIDAPAVNGHHHALSADGGTGISPGLGGGAGGAILITARAIEGLSAFSVVGGNSIRGGGGGGGVIRIGTITALNLSASSYAGGTAAQNRTGTAEGGKLFYNVMVNEGSGVYTAPTVNTSADTAVCMGTEVTLYGYGGPVVAWTVGSDTLSLNSDSLVVVPDSTTKYTAHIMAGGCVDTLHTSVTIYPPPMLDLVDTLTTCPLVPVLLTAPPGFASYHWSTGDTTESVTAKHEGAYRVTVRNEHGCQTSDSIQVVFSSAVRMEFAAYTPGEQALMPEVMPTESCTLVVNIRNTTDSVLTVQQADMSVGTEISAPLRQFPIAIAPFSMGSLTLVGATMHPGVYADTVHVREACGAIHLPVQLVVHETPWFTRCKVRITSTGELDGLLGIDLNDAVVVDVLGRVVHPPLFPGLYWVRVGTTTYAVQMP